MLSVTASAQAEVIPFGKYFAKNSELAIVMAINQRVRAKAALSKDKGINIASPDLGLARISDKGKFKATQGSLKRLGEFMNLNRALLCAVGISSKPRAKLVTIARQAGARRAD